jgi:excisionase family DNA binding protein
LPKATKHDPMHETTPTPLGLSSSQAARALGVSIGTIRRWSDLGYLGSYRTPGGQRRFSPQQIEQFVSSLQQPGERLPAAG